ncbi:glycosyltransferase family 39 protein [Candidatus Giovannonibacteria bacterium]|nr:glycosyltransferase family 39 protein [Candidatus Giovannonibacteria bacterium]
MKKSNIIALTMLVVMFVLLVSSTLNDTATFDEIAHIGAGFTYLQLKDSRLNPEHPPLMKDIAAIGLLFLNLNYEHPQPFWNAPDVNERQWVNGNYLLYGSGNNPDQILIWSRLPIMILAIIFGWLLYLWVQSLYGSRVSILVLTFYAFSPTFLAHSRYVTTDLAAAFGFFIGIATFLRFLEKPSIKRTGIAGLALGIALLLKFSLFLLIPIYGALIILWTILKARETDDNLRQKLIYFLKLLWSYITKIILIAVIALAVIWLVYLWHVWNYPQTEQIRDARSVLGSFGIRPLAELDFKLIENGLTRPFGQYLLGLLMNIQRAAGGNTAYFLGEVSAGGWILYFPTAYLLKESLALHILTLLALFIALANVLKAKNKSIGSALDWFSNNFVLTASLVFIAFYWLYSMRSPLNIGVRHVLPTFPFIYLLVSREVARWIYRPSFEEPVGFLNWLHALYEKFIEPIPRLIFLSLVILWMSLSAFITFPYYLSYYNELVGIDNGYKYINDSNYDWGQDLKRLREEMDRRNIEHIYLNYFGGGSLKYYLGERVTNWWSAKGAPPSGSYFAVSATMLAGAQGKAVGDIKIKPEDSYSWLKGQDPIARGGKSILIFRIP